MCFGLESDSPLLSSHSLAVALLWQGLELVACGISFIHVDVSASVIIVQVLCMQQYCCFHRHSSVYLFSLWRKLSLLSLSLPPFPLTFPLMPTLSASFPLLSFPSSLLSLLSLPPPHLLSLSHSALKDLPSRFSLLIPRVIVICHHIHRYTEF